MEKNVRIWNWMIGGALLAALTGCGSGTSSDTSFSQAPNPTDSCTIEITNPSIPGEFTDIQFSGRGADYQCTATINMAPSQGGEAVRIDKPHGPQACTTTVAGLTVTSYTNDPLAAQNGCAFMKRRTQQLSGG
jgi:hypothetical protein